MPVLFKPRKDEDVYVVWSSLLGSEPLSASLSAAQVVDEIERGVSVLTDSVSEVRSMLECADAYGCGEVEVEQWDKAQVVYNESGETFIIDHCELGVFADRYFEDEDVDASDLLAGKDADIFRE